MSRPRTRERSKRPSMDPAEGHMGSVLSKMSELLECNLPTNLHEDIMIMKVDLRRLRAFYCTQLDAPKGHFDPDELKYSEKIWLSDIREVFYDAENLLDYMLLHTDYSKAAANPERFGAYYYKNMKAVSKLRFAAAESLTLIHKRGTTARTYDKWTGGLVGIDELVGVEKTREVLISLLAQVDDMSEPMKQTKILSIVGIGGVGKTALAQAVYGQLEPKFHCAAFVRAPLLLDMVGCLKEMICQLDVQNGMNVNEESQDEGYFIHHIGQFLQNKRYLVVIDDLWDEDDWHIISRGLPNNDYGSRVITITRLNHIANLCCSGNGELIHEVQPLGYIDSKKLFLKRCFGYGVSFPSASTDVYNEILKMCGGSPSGIISIASLLASKPRATQQCQELINSAHLVWKQTSSSILLADQRDILSLIYLHLPSTLKDCLLYLVVRAKNQMIHRTTTVMKWIAEGFISEFVGCSREEVAGQYFDELIDRNFIQLVEYGNYLGEEIYETNHLMQHALELISHRNDFATIWHDDKISMEYMKSVRLSIQCSGSELSVQTKVMDQSHIRSITIVGPAKFNLTDNLEYLRVLDLDGCKDLNNSALDYICRMILLKYLSLKHTQVTEIPPKIAKLQNLETLDASCTDISCLPPEIGELQNLETLDVSHTKISCLPREIGKLRSLKTLDASRTQISFVPRDIRRLHNLVTLDIRQTHVEELPKEIVQLHKLTHLYFGQISSPRGVKLPAGSEQLKSVEAFGTVDSREWSESAIEEISGLTGVKEIEVVLHDHPADKDQNDKLLSSIGKCENLEYLIIYGDYNPSENLTGSSIFPLLEKLKVAGRFMKVPQWMAQLSSLQKLNMKVCKLDQDDLKILGGLPALSNLSLVLISIARKKEVAITRRLHPEKETSPEGFKSLEVFSFECHVPWITFELGAMPLVNTLHLNLYACPEGKFPSGIINLLGLQKINLQYASQYGTSGGIKKAVSAITAEASIHRNVIDLYVNGNYEVLDANGTEASSHGNPIELSVNADHDVLPPNARVDETISSTKIEETFKHGNPIELFVNVGPDVLLSNTKVVETITGTEIKEC